MNGMVNFALTVNNRNFLDDFRGGLKVGLKDNLFILQARS